MSLKLQFNNLVISNSQQIQQARVQILRKVIQRMRKLKAVMEKHPEDESNKQKLSKCVAIVEYIKKLKKMDAVRFVLLLEKSPATVVTNGKASPHDVAIAMLALNKTMQKLVKHFREQLQSSETVGGETWTRALKEFGKQNSKKKQKAKQRKKGKTELKNSSEDTETIAHEDKKSKKAELKQNHKKQLEIKSSIPKKDSSASEEEENTVSKQVIKAKIFTPKRISNECTKQTANKQLHPLTDSEDEELATEKVLEKPEKRKRINSVASDTSENQKASIQKRAETSRPKLMQEKDRETRSDLKIDYEQPIKAKAQMSTVPAVGFIDPFFKTATGESYISYATIASASDEPVGHKTKDKNEKNTRGAAGGNFGRKDSRNEKRHANNYTWNIHKDNWNTGYNKQNTRNDIRNSLKPDNLHPSWAAKQKQKEANFQGKRIVFDDEFTDKQLVTNKPKAAEVSSSLHPSWAAKQKQKPTITAFQGKKITFGDGDE